jgi:hypothetical protein
MRSKLYTFTGEAKWETVDTHWRGPLSYALRCGVRVTPPVPLRVKVLGVVIEESDEGWINVGGASSLLIQFVQARGCRGESVRIEVGDAVTEELFVEER